MGHADDRLLIEEVDVGGVEGDAIVVAFVAFGDEPHAGLGWPIVDDHQRRHSEREAGWGLGDPPDARAARGRNHGGNEKQRPCRTTRSTVTVDVQRSVAVSARFDERDDERGT